MNIVPSYKALLALKRPEENEIVLVSDTRRIYQYHNKEWVLYEPQKPTMSLYQINKQAMAQAETFTEKSIFLAKKDIQKWKNGMSDCKYFFLLSHDLRYYTALIVNPESKTKFEDVVIECLESIGDIKGIGTTEEKDAVEFWVVPKGSQEAFIGYLFPYNKGVIECQ